MTGLDRAVAAIRTHGLWVTAVLTVGVLVGLLLVSGTGDVLAAVASLDAWRVAAMIGLVTVSYGVRFLKWEYYLRELGVDVSVRTSLLVFVSGLMMVITPGKAGEVWKAWFLRDLRGVPVNRTASVVGAERVTDLLALAAFAFLGVLVYDRSATAVGLVTALFLGGLTLLQWRGACLRLLEAVERVPLVGSHADAVRGFYEDAYALFRPRPLAVAMLVSLVAWGLEGVALWVVLDGLGGAATVSLALFVFGFASVVGAASLLPGGLAAAEASMVGTLVVLGYPRAVAVSTTLVVRAGTLWYGAALGATVFLCYRVVVRRATTTGG